MATILVKKGAGTPSPESLQEAELALDTVDGALYSKLADGSVVQLNDGADGVDLSDYVTEAPIDTKQYVRQDGDWAEIVMPDGGTGAGMVISETEPADPVEGMQWLNPTNGLVLFWDGEKWLEMPGGVDGKDGADGVDGADGAGVDADGNLDAAKVTLGNWTIEEVAGELVFSSGGQALAKVTTAGEIVGKDDVTAFGI